MRLLIFLSLISTAYAGNKELKCSEGTLRLRYGEKVVEEKSSICTNKKRTELMSKGFDKKKIKKDKSKSYSDEGGANPGFLLCERLGAKPEVLEFEVDGKWFELDRCLFEDQSFIDTGTLYKLSH